jgi:hypothetical protein
VEGAHGVGRALAQRLVGDGEQVLDVPAKLAARVRVLSVGHGRKSDPDEGKSPKEALRCLKRRPSDARLPMPARRSAPPASLVALRPL